MRLRDLTVDIIDLDLASAFERGRTHRADLARKPAIRRQIVVFLPHIDGRAEARMRDRAVIAFEIIFEHRLPVRMRPPILALVELEGVEVDAAAGDDIEHRAEIGLQRRRVGVEIDKDEGTQCLDPERQ